MKARKRNSNDEWKEIKYVQLEDSDILYKEEYIEFQHDNLSTELKTFDQTEEEKHWQDVREKAAIAVMCSYITRGTALPRIQVVENSVIYADELVERLKKQKEE